MGFSQENLHGLTFAGVNFHPPIPMLGTTGQTTMKPTDTTKPTANKPAHEIRISGIRATIWKNDTAQGPRYNTTFERSYRDGEQWKTSDSFGRDDLLVVSHIATECYRWINAQPAPAN